MLYLKARFKFKKYFSDLSNCQILPKAFVCQRLLFAPMSDYSELTRRKFFEFCAFGAGQRGSQTMANKEFMKFCRDCKLLSKQYLRKHDVDMLFIKVCGRGRRRIDYDTFCVALDEISRRRGWSAGQLEAHIHSVGGPKLKLTTRAEPVRFHDDPSLYTGVHLAGGPSTVDETNDLKSLADRSAADVRGRKIKTPAKVPVRGGLRALIPNLAPGWDSASDPSSGNTYYFNHSTGETRWDPPPPPLPPAGTALPPPPPLSNSLTATRRKMSLQGIQVFSEAGTTSSSSAAAFRSSGGAGSSIFDRLTDPSGYTGAHRSRFDGHTGRGRGVEGRDTMAASRHAARGFAGHTNTSVEHTFHDSSEFLVRR